MHARNGDRGEEIREGQEAKGPSPETERERERGKDINAKDGAIQGVVGHVVKESCRAKDGQVVIGLGALEGTHEVRTEPKAEAQMEG